MNDYTNWRFEKDADDILWCTLNVPDSKLNILTTHVLAEFAEIVTMLETDTPKGFILQSGKDSGFIAGANIKEFTQISGVDEARDHIKTVHALFDRVEHLSCATVCAINGVCLGGGLELALAFDYRIALDDPKTSIGLPEVLLGIHPGFGGSMRFIRQVGALQGLPLMLAGKSVDASKAKQLGLVDRSVPLRQFRVAAQQLILKKPPVSLPKFPVRLLNKAPVRTLFSAMIRKQLRKKVKEEHYPAPYALLELWEKHGDDEQAMLAGEADSVANLVMGETALNLIRVFHLQEKLKSIGSASEHECNSVHVVGAGVMGGDIAAWCASQGLKVTLQDREAKFIAPAMQRAAKMFKRKLKLKRMITAAKDRLVPDLKGSGVESADVVIEAIIEDVEAKATLFAGMLPSLKPQTILATNTSSIGLDILGKKLSEPGRLVGIHFFNPVAMMQLVEIIYSPETEKKWIDAATVFCRKINRLPLIVKSSPGFLVNRILSAYMNETILMLEEGMQAELIDKVATDFGLPLGPVELADTVGLDICLSVSKIMTEKIQMTIPDDLLQKVEQGHIGKKSGRGFYEYKKGKAVKRGIESASQACQAIEDRLVLRILNECAACLREGIVADADMLDAGMIFGTGFAPFRGGPMHYAKQRGIAEVIANLQTLQSQHGKRFTPDSFWTGLID